MDSGRRVVKGDNVDLASVVGDASVIELDVAPSQWFNALDLRTFPHLEILSIWQAVPIKWGPLPRLTSVSLTSSTADDVQAVSRISSLTHLALDAPEGLSGEWSTPELEFLTLTDPPAIERLSGLGSVFDVTLWGYKGRDLHPFRALSPLSRLNLSDSPNLESLRGIRVQEGAVVSIHGCPALTDLAGIDGVAGVDLNVSDCPGVAGPRKRKSRW